ncbi:MAG: peptidoglycan DD-metalloendopeptidase family protein [Clostridia bacterium]|nr:peptidoglycan DD-metalloendopeptidase family protein [Clostridia bacterium]
MNRKKTTIKALFLTFVICLSVFYFPYSPASAETVEELEEKYQELEEKLEENEKKQKENNEKRDEQKQNVEALESQINDLNSQISILDNKIALLDNDIAALNGNIDSLDAEIEGINARITETKIEISMQETTIKLTREKVLDRLALSYMMGEASGLELLLGAKNLADILTWRQFMQNASDYDRSLIQGLEASIADLNELQSQLDASIDTVNAKKVEVEAEKQEVQAKQAEVQSSADDLEAKKSTVDVKRGEAVALLKTLDSQSAEYKRIEKQLIAEQEKVDAEIDALIASQGSTEGVITVENDGTLIWPVPYDNCYISAPFGQYPSGGPHNGMDICVRGGSYGKNIIAAQSGKAMTVGYGHWSMGNYIILDHGNGLFTAYYHCSKINISQGATVKQGQVIAQIGDTGNTTGPHLHFEVRINKGGTVTRVNPAKYVSMP